jgi:hypothetical protein
MPTDQPVPPKRKLRWYQFGLRTLLIVVTLFAIPCSWLAVKKNQAKRTRDAVEIIKKLGGSAHFDYEHAYYKGADDRRPSISLVFSDDYLCVNVVWISFSDNNRVKDADLKYLEGMELLWTLYLDHTQITDVGLKHLESVPNLSYLTLKGTKVTDAGIAKLRKTLPKLIIER